MQLRNLINIGMLMLISLRVGAAESEQTNITNVISKQEFSLYKDVGDFIDKSPKVTITVPAEQSDIATYGDVVMKTLTGSDCDRDGKMDDNQTCNAVYLTLWLQYER